MKAINIELDKSQFLKIIKQLDDNDKLELFNELKKSLYLVDTNIWISFLIGKNLKGLQKYIDSQTILTQQG
jgi:hypothetical protein